MKVVTCTLDCTPFHCFSTSNLLKHTSFWGLTCVHGKSQMASDASYTAHLPQTQSQDRFTKDVLHPVSGGKLNMLKKSYTRLQELEGTSVCTTLLWHCGCS